MIIEQRRLSLVNTDPQRRCYDGCHFSAEYQWGPWEVLESGVDPGVIKDRLNFWRDLNNYAIRERGKNAEKQFRISGET